MRFIGLSQSSLMIKMRKRELMEIKAIFPELDLARKRLSKVGGKYIGTFRQVDVYFKVKKGRLKIRNVDNSDVSQLVYYTRADVKGPKKSEIILVKLDKKEGEKLKEILAEILGVRTIIKKTRGIYEYRGARVHLDDVEGLGRFIEIEFPISPGRKEEECRKIVEEIMEELEISKQALLEVSYSDLSDQI